MSGDQKGLETKLVHDGEPRIGGALSIPVFQSSTWVHEGSLGYHDVRYARLNNTPNHLALHAKLASIESAEAALVTSSGMAAISTALLTMLAAGDHLLVQETLYGGTHGVIVEELQAFGVTFDFIDPGEPASWESKLRPTTKVIYVETIGNPLLGIGDLDEVPRFARAHGLVSMIDNTFASPVNFRPAEHGFDLSLHSATKYLNGHTDLITGAVIGRADLVHRVLLRLNHLGGTLDMHACFLLHRGLKTLSLRVERQNANAMKLARFLESHPAVASVRYPGLESHPDHERASRLLDGFGGMLAFETRGGAEEAKRFCGRVGIAIEAPSLGGLETLVSLPAELSHAGLPREERLALGITDGLIRVSVGIESVVDLIADFGQALS